MVDNKFKPTYRNLAT